MVDINGYNTLKWDVNSLIDTRRLGWKAEIRTYLGAKTWEYERELSNCSIENKHILALHSAVEDCKKCTSRQDIRKELDRLLNKWRNREGYKITFPTSSPIVEPPVKQIQDWKKNGHSFVSLFSGAFGLDLGFMGAGFEPLLALDKLESSENTLAENLPTLKFIKKDIKDVTTQEILREAGLGVGELDLVTGGPPCQPFSTAGRREGLLDPRASPLREFIRFVKEAQPKVFVMEEVTGLLSARLKHVPYSREKRDLLPEERVGSAFAKVVKMLRSTGYHLTLSDDPSLYSNSVLNAADFGAPQIRNRLIIIGCKEQQPELPSPTHSKSPALSTSEGRLQPWSTFWDTTCDLQGKEMECANLSERLAKYLSLVPPAGYWKDLPEDLIEEAMGGAYLSDGGKTGYFRRLSWDYPSPTVATSPAYRSSMLCHPEELRPISIEEYKRVQGFPDDWVVPGSISTKYLLIGNAVPVHLSYAIAKKASELLNNLN